MDFESTSHAANEAAYLPLKLLFKITYWKRHQELVFRIMVFILQHYAQWPREPRRTDYLHDWYVYPVTDLCMSYVCIVELNKRSSNWTVMHGTRERITRELLFTDKVLAWFPVRGSRECFIWTPYKFLASLREVCSVILCEDLVLILSVLQSIWFILRVL